MSVHTPKGTATDCCLGPFTLLMRGAQRSHLPSGSTISSLLARTPGFYDMRADNEGRRGIKDAVRNDCRPTVDGRCQAFRSADQNRWRRTR